MDNFWNKRERGRDGGGGEIPAKYLEYKPEGVKREGGGGRGGGAVGNRKRIDQLVFSTPFGALNNYKSTFFCVLVGSHVN